MCESYNTPRFSSPTANWLLISLTIGSLTALCMGVAPQQSAVARASWWERTAKSEFSTESHRVRSDISTNASQSAALGIDRTWAMIDAALGSLRPRTRGLQQALLFQSQEDLSETMRSHFAIDPPSAAFAFRSPLGQGIALCTEDTPAPFASRGLLAALCGEYVRLSCGADLPAAVQCGLLDLVARWDGAGGGGGIGDAGAARVRAAIAKKGAPSVQTILAMNAPQLASAVASDSTGSLCEASASIVRFLTRPNSPRGVAAFQAYLRLVAEGTPSSDAFASAYGLSTDAAWSEFDAQWRAFAQREKPTPTETLRERLAFFGAGLQVLESEGAPPADFDALVVELTDRAFVAPKSWRPGFSQLSAECASVFTPSEGCAANDDSGAGSKNRKASAKPTGRSARFIFGARESEKSPPSILVAESQTLRLKLTWFKTRPQAEAPWVWDVGRAN
ncbi:MAG: hypothetical protein EXS17_08485 [Phycisphaerales bacterium]|nr:hypothetical protein [Phycisphaerales bacterium]